MKIEILRCFRNDDAVYGEYYIYDDVRKYLCFQNGTDIKLLLHLYGKRIEDCVANPTQKVIEAVLATSKEYLSTDLKFESVTLEGK